MSDIKLEFVKLLQSLSAPLFADGQKTLSYMQLDNNGLTLTLPFVCNSLFYQNIKDNDSESIPQLSEFARHHNIDLDIKYDVPSVKGENPKVVKNVIAVASGKGGVGKSTTAVNLAAALTLEGAIVGIVDADVYGPSLPTLLGAKGQQPESDDGKHMRPIIVHGLQTMSIGYLVSEDSATIWRGPMASRAFQQLYNETLWQQLDYLIVDMPPGTGDIQLTLAQSLPVTAAVVVTTPQDLALADAIKGIAMFNKVDVPVLGIVENMSYHQCTQCGHKEAIFGAEGGKRVAQKYQTELLAQLPLNINIRELADTGQPIVYAAKEDEIGPIYQKLAQNVSFKLSQQEIAAQQISAINVG